MAPRAIDPTRFTPFFRYLHGHLWCERVPLERVAVRCGTPAYIYSRASIEQAYWQLDGSLRRALGSPPRSGHNLEHLAPFTICYSVKANSNLAILRLLARLGGGFDVVSGGELYRLQQVGVPGWRIVFSGVGKTRQEIREALRYNVPSRAAKTRRGILLFNVESAAELELLAEEASRVVARGGPRAPAAIRVNPDIEAGAHPHISTGQRRHKFGLGWDQARRLYQDHRHSRWIAWEGISAHIGSQIVSLAPFRQAFGRLAAFYQELQQLGIRLRFLDFGGGLAIRYATDEPPDIATYARVAAGAMDSLGCHLLLEPGRVLVGPAGVLLTEVLYRKRNCGKTFIVVDAAMNDFLRPALYGAIHPVTSVQRRGRFNASRIRADVVGPVCETGDYFVQDWPFEEVAPGELLAVWGTGAYGFVSASNYNSRPRPPEVLVEGNRFRIIRCRESRADLLRGE